MTYTGGDYLYSAIVYYPYHEHSDWEIIYQVSASSNIKVRTESEPFSCHLCENELLILPPHTVHNAYSEVPFLHAWIHMDRCDFPNHVFTVKDLNGDIRQLIRMLHYSQADLSSDNRMLCDKLLEVICLYIQKASSDGKCPEFIVRFKTLLLENVGNPNFDLGKAIEKTGYHQDYFRRVFKKQTGLSPMAYLHRLRVDKARNLLCLEQQLSIEEIAGQCGFNDSSYFSTVFRKTEGVSPRSYKNHRPKNH